MLDLEEMPLVDEEASEESEALSRFHRSHGYNVFLSENHTVACRSRSFADAITFSEHPLLPGEISLVELDATGGGWSGHLRVGLTQLDPSNLSKMGPNRPQYALPDLVNMSATWAYAITQKSECHFKALTLPYSTVDWSLMEPIEASLWDDLNFSEYYPNIKTPRGSISRTVLKPSLVHRYGNMCPTQTGSRIGIFYRPRDFEDDLAELYLLMNGNLIGPCTQDIPYKEAPLYAVFDVYGSTKAIRIVQLYGVQSLQSVCKNMILQYVQPQRIHSLPIPPIVKRYLFF